MIFSWLFWWFDDPPPPLPVRWHKIISASSLRGASVCHGNKPPPSQGEWRIAAGRCTCLREELMPESMPGWPISKKREIKDPVPSTNDGWGREEGGRVSLFVCFPLPFRPPSVLFYSQTLSVNLVSTANPVRITNEDYWTGSCGFFLGPCVPVCIYVCMEAVCACVCVGVRVCLTCLWNKNVLVCS